MAGNGHDNSVKEGESGSSQRATKGKEKAEKAIARTREGTRSKEEQKLATG